MGAFNTYIQTQKASIAGPVPFTGTLFPASESIPIVMAQNIRGGFMVLPDIATLVDIPYELLQLQMEVTIAESEGVNRTKFILWQMPPENTKVGEIPGYSLEDYWSQIVVTAPVPVPGPQGEKGWSPVFASEGDGPERVVEKIVDYVGGQGAKPTLPAPHLSYKGSSGFGTKSNATNIKGSKGDTGPASRPEYYVKNGTKKYRPAHVTETTLVPNTWVYASVALEIVNEHTVTRKFRVRAEACVADGPGTGAVSWQVNLLQRAEGPWPTNPFGAGITIDQQYSRQDFVDSSLYPSIHKIVTEAVVQLAPGESTLCRLNMVQTLGSNSFYTQGFIEAFGL